MISKISDLMDSVPDDTVRLRERADVSPERILSLTMNKLGVTRRTGRRVRAFVSVAAAAVLLLTLTFAAFATNAFGVADYFRAFFGGLSDAQAGVIGEIGTTGLRAVTSNGTTVTPLAAFADGSYLYLALEIEAPEGVALNPNTRGTEPNSDGGFYQLFDADDMDGGYGIVFGEGEHDARGYTGEWTWSDETPGDNVIGCVIRITAQVGCEMKWNDGTAKTLRFTGIWSQSPDKAYTQVLDGLWEFDIGGFNTVEPVKPDVAGLSAFCLYVRPDGTEYLHDDYEMTLDTMTVSPLGIEYRYTCAYDENVYPAPGVFRAVMRDGTTVDIWNSDSEVGREPDDTRMYVLAHGYFMEPVSLTDVDYIQFGGTVIPLG